MIDAFDQTDGRPPNREGITRETFMHSTVCLVKESCDALLVYT